MDAIDILGSILGKKAGGSGSGADILRDILVGGARREAPPPSRSAPRSASREPAAGDIEAQARELEDLLNVANKRSSAGATTERQQPTSPPARKPADTATRQSDSRRVDVPHDDDARQNEQAKILVRAMVQAAKCDGEISPAEQQQILGQLESPTPEAVQFLRDELARPLDVREFAWSVPVGMEQQVYTMSLIAIDLDSGREERYLRELAHGLRLAPEVCDQIKERLTGSGSRYVGSR